MTPPATKTFRGNDIKERDCEIEGEGETNEWDREEEKDRESREGEEERERERARREGERGRERKELRGREKERKVVVVNVGQCGNLFLNS